MNFYSNLAALYLFSHFFISFIGNGDYLIHNRIVSFLPRIEYASYPRLLRLSLNDLPGLFLK